MNLDNIKIDNTQTIEDTFQEKYNRLSDSDKEHIHSLFKDKETIEAIKQKLENVVFIKKPPTPAEFLEVSNGYLPQDYLDGLYPYIKKDFIAAMNTDNPFSIISIYGSTRTGKSVLARLFTIYSIIFVSYLRDPHTYYKINKMSRICIYLISFKQDKTNQIYLAPLLDILYASEKFKNERFEKNVYKNGVDSKGIIHYSEASKFGDITFPKLFIVTGKDAGSLVGADIIAGAVSELTFFKQYAPGMTDEMIAQVFTKLFSRIQSTVGFGTFPCWSYIDSSANDANSPVEKMILYDLKENDLTFFRHYVVWEVRPHLYPIWKKTKETFKLFIGDGTKQAHIIEDISEIKELNPLKIIDVPIDLKSTFKRSLIESIRDLAGLPTENENKFISNSLLIEQIFDNPLIKNIEGKIVADSASLPENLIWDKVHSLFFNKHYGEDNFVIKRASAEPRFIHIDPAVSSKGDLLGICMLHKEWSRDNNQIVFVSDFCFAVGPGENGINLAAVENFIIDLRNKGKVTISSVTNDLRLLSSTMEQNLKRKGVNAFYFSVDTSIDPYLLFLNQLHNNNVKAGRNIFLKNNCESLIRIKAGKTQKEKIDHTMGTSENNYAGDWDRSVCGINAKDVSDAKCGALYNAYHDPIQPVAIYEDENKKVSPLLQDKKQFIDEAFQKLKKF